MAEKKTLTEKQKLLLSKVWECGGDPIKAARLAGYSDPYDAVASVKEELIDLAQNALSRLATKAVANLENVLDADVPVKGAADKMKAAQLILDRTNPKTDKVEISTEKGSIFILPDKKTFDE
jgi:hypothetical protein